MLAVLITESTEGENPKTLWWWRKGLKGLYFVKGGRLELQGEPWGGKLG